MVSDNRQLTSLSSEILQISSLTKLDCRNCVKLEEPPYQEAFWGWEKIQQYFEKLAISQRPIISTVTILGSEISGKEDVIDLIANEYCRKNRLLFEGIAEYSGEWHWEIDGYPIQTFNFTNDTSAAYKSICQHNKTIPLVVVNICQFHKKSLELGYDEATRLLVLNYLSFLKETLSAPVTPLLVITGKESFKDKEFNEYLSIMLKHCEDLKSEFLQPEYISNVQTLFDGGNVFIQGREMHWLPRVKNALKERLEYTLQKNLSPLSKNIIAFLKTKSSTGYVKLTELRALAPNSSSNEIQQALKVSQNAGYLLWLESNLELSSYVFYDIKAVDNLLKLFIGRNSVEDFEASNAVDNHNSSLSAETIQEWTSMFDKTGLMSYRHLTHIIQTNPSLNNSIAIALLKEFHIVFEQEIKIQAVEPHYVVPSLMNSESKEWLMCTPVLRVDVQFEKQYPLRHMYFKMGALPAHMLNSAADTLNIFSNGLNLCRGEKWAYQVIYDWNRNRLIVQRSIQVEDLKGSWNQFLSFLKVVLQQIKQVAANTSYKCKYFCPHCLLVSPANLEDEKNVTFLNELLESNASDLHGVTFTCSALKNVKCAGSEDVPDVLLHPCE